MKKILFPSPNSRSKARLLWGALATILIGIGGLANSEAAPAPSHNITAANITVVQLGFENPAANVIVTNSYAIGDFRVLPSANRGDYDIQIGEDYLNDVPEGIVMTSVAQNGRDNFDEFGAEHPLYPGTNFATAHIDFTAAGYYFIPVTMTWPNSINTSVIEYNINVSAAYFRYDQWIAGRAHYSDLSFNNQALDAFTGTAGLTLGTHFIDQQDGSYVVNLTSLGIDSRTDGVLLVLGAKNEDNYGLGQVNATNGTWLLYSKDNGTDGASREQDPMAFVFVPKTNNLVVSGRFRGDGSIAMYNGNTPQFTVTSNAVGTYELKIPGHSPAFGVLIISPEGGETLNRDNIVTYQVNAAGDGWIIESRDLPGVLPPLESPGTEAVASFVYIPGATYGVSVSPTNGLFSTENSGTAQFSVVLDLPPSADVTIDVSSSNSSEGTVSPATLTFTPTDWNVPQVVTVTGQDDVATDGAIAYNVVLAAAVSTDTNYSGVNPSDVAVVNLDNDGGFTVNPTSGLATTEAGGQTSFTIVLNRAPTADVTIGLSSDDLTEGTVSPASVVFNNANWETPQIVTITGANDFVDDGAVAYNIVTAPAVSTDLTFNGLNPANVAVSNTDDDTVGVVVSAAGSFGLAVPEGRTTNYTVVLASEPSANVTVTVAGNNPTQGGTVAPPTLTFTPANWSNAQPVTITGAEDVLSDGSTAWFITNSITSSDLLYNVLAPISVAVTTLDNEPIVTLSATDAIYGTGMSGVGIDGRGLITDPATPSYHSGVTLTATLTANGAADDRLEIRNTGNAAGQIGVTGNTISFGGTAIGTFTGGVGLTPLVVTFNNAATPASGQALLRNVTFRTLSNSGIQNTRTVSVILDHGDGGKGQATRKIRVGLLRLSDFQEGADYGYGPYTGTADIELFESQPDTTFPNGHNATGLWVGARRAGFTDESQILLRYENIFGNGPGQIPTNALIVSAELVFDVNDSGHGSPLVRMLVPWNAQNETWNSLGGGITLDDVEARSTVESQFGVTAISGLSTAGTISFAVTPDIQAWADGATNYGWGLTSWDPALNLSVLPGSNPAGLSPSEAANINDRPRLRVLWFSTNSLAASFRQDVNGYTGARDTRIRANAADTSFAATATVFVDWEVTAAAGQNEEHVLLGFNDIIGTEPGQIPPGATVHAAVLDLAGLGGDAMGDGGKFHAMLRSWEDTDTWNSLVNGISIDDVEALSVPTAVAGNVTLNPDVQGGYLNFELTPDVQAWVSGTRSNYGWAGIPWPNGGNGWGFGTSEQGIETSRPRLRVYYSPGVPVEPTITLQVPTVSPGNVQVNFSGAPNTSYHVLRAPTVIGPWTTNGTVVTSGSGAGAHADNAPLSGAAFYRALKP